MKSKKTLDIAHYISLTTFPLPFGSARATLFKQGERECLYPK